MTSPQSSQLELRPISEADVPSVADFLAVNLGGSGGAARYRRMLQPRWSCERPNFGFMLHDEQGVQGALGLVYSDRVVAGQRQRFCNMTSWCVIERHRRLSLLLLRAMAEQPGYIFTNFSPTPTVATILERTGFQRLDGGKFVVPLVGAGMPKAGVRVLRRPAEVRAALTPEQRVTFDDHAAYRCGQFALLAGGECCYIVTVKRGRGALYFADVIHASLPRLLGQNLASLFVPALRRHATLAIGVDARFLEPAPRIARFLPRPSYFKGEAVHSDDVSSIYSEIVGIYG